MGFCDRKKLDILRKIFKRFCFCLEDRPTSHCMIDITLSKHRVENIIARYFTLVNLNRVSDLETFPHGVVVKLFKKTWLGQLDLTKLSQSHVVEDIQPETLLDHLDLAHMLRFIKWLDELH